MVSTNQQQLSLSNVIPEDEVLMFDECYSDFSGNSMYLTSQLVKDGALLMVDPF